MTFLFSLLVIGLWPIVVQAYSAVVRGQSMAPLLQSDAVVEIDQGYLAEHELARGHLVAVRSRLDWPLVKRVVAMPGDSWSVTCSDSGCSVHVNGESARTSTGSPYLFRGSRARVLTRYARFYPILPPRSYLLLGENPRGTYDSTRFGLVHADDIIGRVFRLPAAEESGR